VQFPDTIFGYDLVVHTTFVGNLYSELVLKNHKRLFLLLQGPRIRTLVSMKHPGPACTLSPPCFRRSASPLFFFPLCNSPTWLSPPFEYLACQTRRGISRRGGEAQGDGCVDERVGVVRGPTLPRDRRQSDLWRMQMGRPCDVESVCQTVKRPS